MMKLRNLTLVGAIALGLFACGGSDAPAQNQEETKIETASDVSGSFTVDAAASEVAWYGEIAKVKSHNGVISISEGNLEVTEGQLTGGKIVIDMTTIVPLDSANYTPEDSDKGGKAGDFVGHLSNNDFFLVEEFPTASFVVKSVADGKLVGDLTIRDKTNEETVELSELTVSAEGVSGKGKLVFDRQKYDVAYTGAKDFLISNDITLTISIVAKK